MTGIKNVIGSLKEQAERLRRSAPNLSVADIIAIPRDDIEEGKAFVLMNRKEYRNHIKAIHKANNPQLKPLESRNSSALKRLAKIAEIIECVENRCMAADGPVTPTLDEMTPTEIRQIYQLAGDEPSPKSTPSNKKA